MGSFFDKVLGKSDTVVDEQKTLSELKEYYQEAKVALDGRRDKWKKNYQYYNNDTLSEFRPRYRSDIRVNYCSVIVETKTPVLTQNRPTVNFVAFDDTEQGRARGDLLSKIVGNALWNKLCIQDTLEDVIKSSEIFDAGIWKIGWDPSVDNGIGEVFVSSIDPFKFMPDPMAKDIASARYVIHMEPYAVSTLKKKYPQYADKIKEDSSISELLYEDRLLGENKNRRGVVTNTSKFKVKRAYVKEYWLAPSECDLTIMETTNTETQTEQAPIIGQDEQPVLDASGNPVTETKQTTIQNEAPKYRNGRVITTINDQTIVDDKPNPYAHGKFPFVVQKIRKMPNEFWGKGDIEDIIPLQDALNHRWQQIDDIASKTANTFWIIDDSIPEDDIKKVVPKLNQPGGVVIAPMGKIQQITGAPIPQYLITSINLLIQQIGTVSGITEIMQGRVVTHRTAKGIERMEESAINRIGLSVDQMELALKQVGFLIAEVAQQFYTEQRTFALVGTNGDLTESLTFNPEDLAGEFELSIDSGATLPKDKQSKADLVFNLLANHIFDMALGVIPGMPVAAQKMIAETVLSTVQYPGREKLLSFNPAPPAPPAGPSIPLLPGGPSAATPPLPPVGPASVGPQGPPSLPLNELVGSLMPRGPQGPLPPAGPSGMPQEVLDMMKQLNVNSLPELIRVLGLGK